MSSLAHRLAAARRRREVGQGETLALRIRRALETWRRRAQSRTQLAHLDQRELRDIGLTPAEAARECAKPFWRD
ncbi:MAG TPA: DUF1127 domain-containing protein [Stellaceae bacterium]|nr:DUF1127 domain-containing protein [Stellaceae bacterium]